VGVSVLLAGAAHGRARITPEQQRDLWLATYGVASEDDALVVVARRTLRVLLPILPPPGGGPLDLLVLRKHPEANSWVLDARTLVITHNMLAFCCGSSSTCDQDGRAALALVLGHELAHLVSGDYWQPDEQPEWHDLSSEARSEIQARPSPASSYPRELKADDKALRALLLAGFAPRAFLDREGFLARWASLRPAPAGDGGKPSAGTLQESLRAVYVRAQRAVEPLHFGVRLLQLGGRHADAILLLESSLHDLPGASREQQTNLGSARLEQALQALALCDSRLALRFMLPRVLDPHTLAVRSFRGVGESSACARAPQIQGPLEGALAAFDMALGLDTEYWPARLNRASARVLQAVLDPSRAAEALNESPAWPADLPAAERLDSQAALFLEALAHLGVTLQPWSLHLARHVAWFWLSAWEDPQQQHLAALARHLFLPAYVGASASRSALDDLSALRARHCAGLELGLSPARTWHNCIALQFNIARLQSERGEAESARASFEAFLQLQPSGAFADAARRELGRARADDLPDASPSRALVERLTAAHAAEARKCDWRTLSEGRSSPVFAVCERGRLKALRIDKTVELYEWDLGNDGPTAEVLAREQGAPRAYHESPLGRWTWVYADRAYDLEVDAHGQRRAVTEVLFTPLPAP
jgi:tetratricopeptide (TPR) repeat protein